MKLLHSIFFGLAAAQFSSLLEFSNQAPVIQENAGERKKNKPTDLPPIGADLGDNKGYGNAGDAQARLKKIMVNCRDWIKDYASNYKKRQKLETLVDRTELKYEKAFKSKSCRLPSIEEARMDDTSNPDEFIYNFEDFENNMSDFYRKLPDGGAQKAEKLTKVLNKLRNENLATCKKTKSLPAIVQRLRQAFLDALEKQGSKKEKIASRTLKKSEKRARKEAKKAKKGKNKSMETFGYSDGFQFDIEEEYEEY